MNALDNPHYTYFTQREVAEVLHTSQAHVSRLVLMGRLESTGGQFGVHRDAVMAYAYAYFERRVVKHRPERYRVVVPEPHWEDRYEAVSAARLLNKSVPTVRAMILDQRLRGDISDTQRYTTWGAAIELFRAGKAKLEWDEHSRLVKSMGQRFSAPIYQPMLEHERELTEQSLGRIGFVLSTAQTALKKAGITGTRVAFPMSMRGANGVVIPKVERERRMRRLFNGLTDQGDIEAMDTLIRLSPNEADWDELSIKGDD